jgi:hypothetical protein
MLSMVQFAVVVLGLKLYVWQAAVMASVAKGIPTAAVTPNGAGKTSIIIKTAALWCLHEYPGSTVVVTSATFRAVRAQVFGALEQDKGKFAGWTWNETEITDARGGRIIGFSTDSGAKFEGFHAYPDRPLMIIIDEAKTVADDIFVAVDRCQPTFLLYISSPGGNFGRFHDAFKNARFAAFEVGSQDCPHITPEYIAAMKEQYGEDSDIYRSMVEGLFAKGTESGKVIQFVDYERCATNPPPWREGMRQAFCDFADSGDLCIIAGRNGNRLRFEDVWKPDGDKAHVTDRFETTLRRLQDQGYDLYGDEDGTGHGYITALNLRGIRIRGVRNNAPASKPAVYFNLNAEQWWTFSRQLAKCQWILPTCEHAEVLKRQLCERHQNYVERDGKKVFGREDGRLQLQPKRKEKGSSPNHADAIVGAAFDYPAMEAVSYVKNGHERASAQFPDALPSRWSEAEAELQQANSMAGMGWDV